MRPNNNQRGRQRGRNGGGGGGGGGKPNKPQRNQTFDSSGPEVRVRGNAHQIFEKYQVLAREASTAGDRIAAESYYQHAEHYLRMINAMGGFNRPQDQWREGDNMDDQSGPDGRGDGRGDGPNGGPNGGRNDGGNDSRSAPSNGGYHGQGPGGENNYRQNNYGRDQQGNDRQHRDMAEIDQPDASFGAPSGRDPQDQS
jgi:hypothetical protein